MSARAGGLERFTAHTRRAPNPYLPVVDDRPAALDLLCFHHAGGAASSFATWQAALGSEARVLAVQLPGRERRVRELRLRDMATLLGELRHSLGYYLRGRYAFYGHSMGALVAFALAHAQRADGEPGPARLLVGAHAAPDLPRALGSIDGMDDDALGRLLVGMGGMSEQLLNYPDWMQAATSLVRDDLAVCHGYRMPAHRLSCPVDVFTGEQDALVSVEAAAGWARHTTGETVVHRVPGGHFFPREHPEVFLPKLSSVISAIVAAPDDQVK